MYLTKRRDDNEIHDMLTHVMDQPLDSHIFAADRHMRKHHDHYYSNCCNDANTYLLKELNHYEENPSVYYCIYQINYFLNDIKLHNVSIDSYIYFEDLNHYINILCDYRSDLFRFMINNSHLRYKCQTIYDDCLNCLTKIDAILLD